jgi:positive regulator of sigma E activity
MLVQFLENVWTALGASSNQIVALAAMVGTVFAYIGLRTWRRQLKGTSETNWPRTF